MLVISFDALRADHLGFYGYGKRVSPNLDALASQAIVFNRAYSTAPVTPTSFAAAFTGRLPTQSFIAWKLAPEETLAELFRQNGYTTVGFFNNVFLDPVRGFDTGFDSYRWFRNLPSEEFLDLVLESLASRTEGPVFLWVHFLVPHAPYLFRQNSQHLYAPDYRGPFQLTTQGTFLPTTTTDAARIESLYDGQIYYADSLFQRLWEALGIHGYLDDAAVVVTSDHGEEFGEHGGYQHGKLFQEHLQIPFLIWRSGLGQRGWRTDVLYRNIDLLPTLLGIIGAQPPQRLDGVDLVRSPAGPEMNIAIAMTGAQKKAVSIQEGYDKLLWTCTPEFSLERFDLAADPFEAKPVAVHLTESRLQVALRKALGGNPCEVVDNAVRGATQTLGIDADSIDALKALGYLQTN